MKILILDKEKNIKKIREGATYKFLEKVDGDSQLVQFFDMPLIKKFALLFSHDELFFIRLPSILALICAVVLSRKNRLILHVAAKPVVAYRVKSYLLRFLNKRNRTRMLITGDHIAEDVGLSGIRFLDSLATGGRVTTKLSGDIKRLLVVGRKGKRILNPSVIKNWIEDNQLDIEEIMCVGYDYRLDGWESVKNVLFYDQVSHDKMLEMYNKCDAFLFLSVEEYEGIPRTICEALSKGLPVFHNGQECIKNFNNSSGLIRFDSPIPKVIKVSLDNELGLEYNIEVVRKCRNSLEH